MYAIIDEAGRQFKVSPGDTLRIERQLEGEEKTLTFERVLLVAGDGEPMIGDPLVPGATVTADVLGTGKGKKIDIVKYKRRKGYHRKTGHRQPHVQIKITGIHV
jgi:large subunit ribosomal protein L21